MALSCFLGPASAPLTALLLVLPSCVYLPTCCPWVGLLPSSWARSPAPPGTRRPLPSWCMRAAEAGLEGARGAWGDAKAVPVLSHCLLLHWGLWHLSCHRPGPPGRLVLSPELSPCPWPLALPAWLQGDAGRRLLPIVCQGGNGPVPSPSWDWRDPARKRHSKCFCSPHDGAVPLAVPSPLICLFPGLAGHNWALSGPCCTVSSPGPVRCQSGGLLRCGAGAMPSGRAEP